MLKISEQSLLARYARDQGLAIRTVDAFIGGVLVDIVYHLRASLIGFNLPFDISRLASGHANARGTAYRGGFSFKFTDNPRHPRIRIKHLSSRAALKGYTVPANQRASRGMRRRKNKVPARRGYMVDVKTLAAALTGQGHTLASLAKLLETKQKLSTDEHGGRLTRRYLEYAVNDVQVTWECYAILRDRYLAYGLTKTQPHEIYSEASIGKAYLKQIGVQPWLTVQPDIAPEIIGIIMSTYFGGRSDVRIRREVICVLYSDFLSMYPTVCIFMGLWRYVIAQGVRWEETTEATQQFLAAVDLDSLQKRTAWTELTTLVQVAPDGHDLFPVRARYAGDAAYTIGLNNLESTEPLRMTLADCIASKISTGRTPTIVKALRFYPLDPQRGLKSIAIGGNERYRVDPYHDDLYLQSVNRRAEVKQDKKAAEKINDANAAAKYDAEQLGLKIMANATSYGIFVELNVNDLTRLREVTCYGAGEPFSTWVNKTETPGKYCHPLLATLITGAARLMLAIAQRLAADQGIDWALCDTDSLAFAQPAAMKWKSFHGKVESVRQWFEPLNPYARKESLLKLEDVNFRIPRNKGGTPKLEPLYCYAISPKRYALFNLRGGRPIIRSAMAHGLGHLRAPYSDDNAPPDLPKPEVKLSEIGVDRWQHDFWLQIIQAALSDRPDQVDLAKLPGFDLPAVSRYGATTPELLSWFDQWNSDKEYPDTVKPFNFLLTFFVSKTAWFENVGAIHDQFDEMPKAVSPFDSDIHKASRRCFDRNTGLPVPASLLKTYAEVLRHYHLHPEAKYRDADYMDRGIVAPRHLRVTHVEHIGKEANRWEEQLYLGEAIEEQIEYVDERQLLVTFLRQAKSYSVRDIARTADLSPREVATILLGHRKPSRTTVAKLSAGVKQLELQVRERSEQEQELLETARQKVSEIGLREFARTVGVDPANLGLVVKGRRPLGRSVHGKLMSYFAHQQS